MKVRNTDSRKNPRTKSPTMRGGRSRPDDNNATGKVRSDNRPTSTDDTSSWKSHMVIETGCNHQIRIMATEIASLKRIRSHLTRGRKKILTPLNPQNFSPTRGPMTSPSGRNFETMVIWTVTSTSPTRTSLTWRLLQGSPPWQ